MNETVAAVRSGTLSDEQWRAAVAARAELVVMPSRRDDQDRGVYGEATVFLVKELRAAGIDAAFADPAEQRRFEVRKSVLGQTVATVALGVVSSGAWEALKALLRRQHPRDQVMEISYAELSADGDRTVWTVRGPAEEALEAIDRLREDGAP